MPKNDYTDPELRFPRIQARAQKIDDHYIQVQLWLRKEPGEARTLLMSKRVGGNLNDMHRFIQSEAEKYGAECTPDDIWTDYDDWD